MEKGSVRSVFDVLSEEELRSILKSIEKDTKFGKYDLQKAFLSCLETPSKLYEEYLRQDEFGNYAKHILNSPYTPSEVLEKIYEDPEYTHNAYTDVIEGLIRNKNTPKDVLLEIIKTERMLPEKLMNLSETTENPAILEAIFERCLNNEQWEHLSEYNSARKDELIRRVLTNPISNTEMFRKASQNKSSDVRRFVAKNERCPEDDLKRLSKDSSKSVREAVLLNPNISNEILESLLKDKSHTISQEAQLMLYLKEAQDPRTSGKRLDRLVDNATKVIDTVERYEGPKKIAFNILRETSSHPNIYAKTINTIYRYIDKYPSYEDIVAMVKNPKVSDQMVENLMKLEQRIYSGTLYEKEYRAELSSVIEERQYADHSIPSKKESDKDKLIDPKQALKEAKEKSQANRSQENHIKEDREDNSRE